MAHIFSQVRRKFGFSLIEVIVVISIIGALSIVAYVAAASFSESRNNSKRIADISTLKGALETMLVETKTLPDPTANRSFYLVNGGYAHSQSGAYGVSSSFSEDILGKYTLADHPKDPKTGGFYSYGRNFDAKPSYDIAAVINENGENIAYLRGTSDGKTLPSLIKAFDQGSFVEDGKSTSLPYNPYARELIGRITAYTGSVSITPAKALTASLVIGDEIRVSAGGLANIKISDGSEITLGNPTSDSVLKINELKMKDDTGLFTRVRIALSSGEMWTKAPKLREFDGSRSDFEVETQGTVAAVRGTIFGVNAGTGTGSFTLYEGKIQLENITGAPVVVTGSGATGTGTIEVIVGATPISVNLGAGVGGTSLQSTPVTPTAQTNIENKLTQDSDTITNSIARVLSYTMVHQTLTINFNDEWYTLARASIGTGTSLDSTITRLTSTQFNFPVNPLGQQISIVFCKDGSFGTRCTQPYEFTPTADTPKTVSLQDLGNALASTGTTSEDEPCSDQNPVFCKNSKLIAYAEYDNDLDLRVRSGAVAGNTTGLEIANYQWLNGDNYTPWVTTNGMFMPSNSCININNENTSILMQCKNSLWLNDDTPISIFTDSYSSQQSLRKSNFTKYVGVAVSDFVPNWSQLGILKLTPSVNGGFTGVYVNDNYPGGKLSYDGWKLWPMLMNPKWTVLEFGVRGAVFKETVKAHNLFSAENNISSSVIKIWFQWSNLTFYALDGAYITLPVPIGNISDKELYTIRVTVDPMWATPTTKLEIIGPGVASAVVNGTGNLAGASGIVNVFVGGKSTGGQWNDFIDFFRISQL